MEGNETMDLAKFVRDVPDFPKPGIVFKDITPLLASPEAIAGSVAALARLASEETVDYVVGVEARGFIFGAPLAIQLEVGFVPVRKPGKLPAKTSRFQYDLEYGTDALEIHTDALQQGSRVLIVDDLLATGGTVNACCQLVAAQGASIVACLFLIDLTFLGGASRLEPHPVRSVLQY